MSRPAGDNWQDGDVDNDGVRLHFYRTGGALPPIVLVHGFSDNGLCWRRVARMLEPAYDVVMVDSRNHGRSATALGGIAVQASDLASVIEALELDDPVVVGHSVGAATAAELAARRPDLVNRLVLEDPPWRDLPDGGRSPLARRREEVARYIDELANMTDEQVHELGRRQHPEWDPVEFDDWVAAKRQLRIEAAGSLEPHRWSDVVDQIECSTLLLHGDSSRGGLLTGALARQIDAGNPHIEARRIDDAGHNIRRENFSGFAAVLGDFFERQTAPDEAGA